MKKLWAKNIPRIILLSCLLLVTGCFLIDNSIPYAIIKPMRCSEAEARKYFSEGIYPGDFGLDFDTFYAESIFKQDTLSLESWFVYARQPSELGTVMLIHGVSSCKYHLAGAAAFLADQGFNVVLTDLRAHGNSGGQYNTFGYYERHDLKAIVDHVQAAYPQAGPIGILGNSLGGAIALQALAEDERIVCGVIESTFAALDEIVEDYFKQQSRLGFAWLARRSLRKAAVIADFDPAQIRPEASADSIEQPVLMVHGEEDQNIDISYGRRIYEHLASPHKQWLPIAGADHDNLWQTGGEAYKKTLLSFFRKWLATEKSYSP